jgi:hypothetical protein
MRVIKLFLVIVFLVAGPAARADNIWNIAVNTSSISGTTGYLEFQFDPGLDAVAFATTSVEGFSSDGVLDLSPGALETFGDVNGNLPGTVTLTNETYENYYSPGFTYGTFIDFTVDLSLLGLGTPFSGSTFGFFMYDSGLNPLLANGSSPGGEAFDLDLNPDYSTSVINYSAQTQITTPEPNTLLLLFVPALALLRRRRG